MAQALTKALTEEQIDECRQVFSRYENEDNCINLEELVAILKELDLPIGEDQMRQYRHSIDVGEYRFLDFPELLLIVARKNLESDIEDEIKELYGVFDSRKNGYVTAVDLKAVLIGLNPRITDDQVDSIILEADKDGDGVLSYQQFVYMCMPK